MLIRKTYGHFFRRTVTLLGGLLCFRIAGMVTRTAVIYRTERLYRRTVINLVAWRSFMPTTQKLALIGKNDFEYFARRISVPCEC